jgi:hypothetical protein
MTQLKQVLNQKVHKNKEQATLGGHQTILILDITKPVLKDAIAAVTELQHMPEEINALVFRILRMSEV